MLRGAYRLVTISLLALVLSGCGSEILKALFDTDSGSPHGPLPGAPEDDHASAVNLANPKISNGELVFTPANTEYISFYSKRVASVSSDKTITWSGHLQAGSGPFSVLIYSHDPVMNTFPIDPMILRFTDNHVDLAFSNETPMASSDLPPNDPHVVFITLQLSAGTYKISITNTQAPKVVWTGPIPTATLTQLQSKPRLVLAAKFLSSASTGRYHLDDLVMREK